jgi:hypothetical protein
VYASDIKKVVGWYTQLVKIEPELFTEKEETKEEPGKDDE